MKRSKTIHTAAIGMLCLATLTTGACVTRSTYETATADLEVTKAELQSARAETQGLTQQVSDLQQRKSDLANQMVVASMALEQATKEMQAERTASQKRLSNLNRTIKQLTTQQKSLQDGFKRATKQRASLQSAVDDYTSKLSSVDELHASPTPPPTAMANEPVKTALVSPAQTPAPNEPGPKPTVTTTAAPVSQPVANPVPPLAGQPPEPVEEDWLTFLKNWISSLWQSVVFF
jgi:peptidoglycan hydrolase CwlO-like protein